MPYCHTCSLCGSHLDPGEECGCGNKKEPTKDTPSKLSVDPSNTVTVNKGVETVQEHYTVDRSGCQYKN